MASQFVDNQTISDDDELWRRIPPQQWVDCPGETCRPSSAAFEDSADGSPLSVHIGRLTSTTAVLSGPHGLYAIAAFRTRLARECGFIVVADPNPDDPSHALVVGNKTTPKRKRIVKGCWWVQRPAPRNGR